MGSRFRGQGAAPPVGSRFRDTPFEWVLGSTGAVGIFASLTASAGAVLAWAAAALVGSLAASAFVRKRF